MPVPLLLLTTQEHYGLPFTNFVKGNYADDHPTMPGMPYLELKGSIVTKNNKISGSTPTLFETRKARRLVDNPNDCLSPYRLYDLLRGFAHPSQEFIYCYRANRDLQDQYSSLPDCCGFQMDPMRRIGKNSIGKVRRVKSKSFLFPYVMFFQLNVFFTIPFSSVRNSTKKQISRMGTSSEITAGASLGLE